MLGGSVNNITMIVVGLALIFMIVVFGIYALLNNNNTETLEDSVRSALVANRYMHWILMILKNKLKILDCKN